MTYPRTSYRWLLLSAVASIVFVLGLAACQGERPRPIVDRPQQRVTDQYLTEVALENATPTPGPSPTPTITPTPYQTATQFPEADPGAVVARVGNREITLAEYQARVRYERWLPFYAIARDIPDLGLEILDLTRPENTNVLSLLYTVNNDPKSFGRKVMDAMLTDQIVLREAGRIDLELEQTIYDGRLAARLDIELGEGGARPDNWDQVYNQFISDLELYTGMSEQQFQEHIRALAYYQQLSEIISSQAPLPNEDIATEATIQDILLDTRADAVAVIDRLQNGEEMSAIAASFGQSLSEGEGPQRQVTRTTEGLTEELLDALFAAQPGDIVGPIATEAGWYVAKVIEFNFNLPEPADLDTIRRDYYQNWIVERLDDPDYTQVFDNWQDFTPTDPLPKDVSPYFVDENFVVPEDPFALDEDEATPTPLPLGNSPR